MAHYKGDWSQVVQHVRVRGWFLSEQDRVGIGTSSPRTKKNQDSTELTGDINYRQDCRVWIDSDPRAFNFDGEFNMPTAGSSNSLRCSSWTWPSSTTFWGLRRSTRSSPRSSRRPDVDEVILGHTNEAEYKKADLQRIHGGLARPHRQDDIPTSRACPRNAESTPRTTTRPNPRQAHRAAHAGGGGHVAVMTRLENPKKHQFLGAEDEAV